MNHHQCDIHMHPAAYVHGPVLITYLRDILAVGFWLSDLAASTQRSVDYCRFFYGLHQIPTGCSRPPPVQHAGLACGTADRPARRSGLVALL